MAAGALALGVAGLCLRGDPASASAVPNPGAPPAPAAPRAMVWPAPGLTAPRCVRIDHARGRVFACGTDGALHVFDLDGRLHGSHPLPLTRDGNPQGIALDRDGNVLVADTHAARVLRLAPDGALLGVYGRRGAGTRADGPGEFDWTTGVCEAPDGTLWVTEYGIEFDGDHDRLHHLRADGAPIAAFGGTGKEPGKFYRPSNVVVAGDGLLWVADACNHRLQVLDAGGTVRQVLDAADSPDGPLRNPYDLWFDGAGGLLVAEFGASRVRRLDLATGAWATVVGPGHAAGEACTPWGVATAPGLLLVADTGNGRLQAFAATGSRP